MIKQYPDFKSFQKNESRAASVDSEVINSVSAIISRVRQGGDAAIREFTHRFDSVELDDLRVPQEESENALARLEPRVRDILQKSKEQVEAFHAHQLPNDWFERTTGGGISGMRFTAVARAGIYVPGGRAGYPSTVLMTVVPAQLAGVDRIALVSPPDKNGCVNQFVLAAAALLKVDEIYAIGGAQAIAGLAYGTESIKPVDKIVGPGNSYVNEAKRQVFGQVGIDSLAGPTELVVVADETANPEWVVFDMFAQAEHDPDARAICVSTSAKLAQEIVKIVEKRLPQSERREIVAKSLQDHGAIITVENLSEAAKVVDFIAPEHLEILISYPEAFVKSIRNAGAIFFGSYSPAVAGDYCCGPNHVLPTGRSARFSSPLSVLDFMKFSSVLSFSENQFKEHADQLAKFAELEGLPNHQKAITCRM